MKLALRVCLITTAMSTFRYEDTHIMRTPHINECEFDSIYLFIHTIYSMRIERMVASLQL